MAQAPRYNYPQLFMPHMGLRDAIVERRSRVLPQEVGDAAVEVIPHFFTEGDDAPKYREHLLESYRTRDGVPPKRSGNRPYRSVDESRLDRAWQDVSERMDKSESTIRSCVLNIYDGEDGFESKPDRLRSDFNEILRVAQNNSNSSE